jgi:hypothetical protein
MVDMINMTNIVLNPESTKPMFWPIFKYPCNICKQSYINIYDKMNYLVEFTPGIHNNELKLNNVNYNICRYNYMMNQVITTACSMKIYAKYILYNNKKYYDSYRLIYIPFHDDKTNILGIKDIETIWKLECINLDRIEIYRHLQFITKIEYNELFESTVNYNGFTDFNQYKDYMNYYIYNNQKEQTIVNKDRRVLEEILAKKEYDSNIIDLKDKALKTHIDILNNANVELNNKQDEYNQKAEEIKNQSINSENDIIEMDNKLRKLNEDKSIELKKLNDDFKLKHKQLYIEKTLEQQQLSEQIKKDFNYYNQNEDQII